jgi:CBS domain containing-hemolysin-like protein
MNVWLLLLAVFLLLANGFFVAVEFALIASRRTKLETLAEQGRMSARLALDATRDLSAQLAGAQLGITMASLGLGAVAEPAIADLLEDALGVADLPVGLSHTLAFILGLGIVVFLHMVVGEMVPKNIAIAMPERVALWLAIPNRVYVLTFRPLIRSLNLAANWLTRRLGVEPRDELATVHTADELARMLAESRDEGLIGDFAHSLLSGALRFGERPVERVVVRVDDVVMVPRHTTVEEAERVAVSTGHSRLLVVDNDLDDTVGYVHLKDLLTVGPDGRDRPIPHGRIRRVLVVTDSTPLDEVLVAMRRARTHLAVVRGRDGHAAGIATLEDVVSELVGTPTVRHEAVTIPKEP